MTNLLFIAIDAATWKVINPLMQKGSLPTISSLVKEGVSAPLQSLPGYKSPALWMSIATGKMPEKTGITYFSNLFLDLPKKNYKKDLTNHFLVDWPLRLGKLFSQDLKSPSKATIKCKQAYIYSMLKYGNLLAKWNLGGNYLITSSFLKEKTIWDILSEEKISCGVVSWLVTWPADPVYGALISQKTIEGLRDLENSILLYKSKGEGNLMYPATMLQKVKKLNKTPSEINDTEIETFFESLTTEEKEQVKSMQFKKTNLFNFFARVYLSDCFSGKSALHVKAKLNPQFLTVYFPGLDGIQHMFWQYMKPEEFPFISYLQEELKKFGKVIEKYYAFLDQQISTLIDNDTIVIIASDHGMEAIPQQQYNQQTLRSGQHEDSPDGVLIMKGSPLKKDFKLASAHILGLAPTVLYLLGKEIDEDMDGSILTEAIDPDFLQNNPPKKKKYGKREPKEYSFYTEAEEQKVKERLKVLGYLD